MDQRKTKKSLEIELLKLRTTIETRRKETEQKTNEQMKSQSLVIRFAAFFVNSWKIMANQDISISDFADLNEEMTCKDISLKIDNHSNYMIKNKVKYKRILSKVTNLAGLYDFHIKHLTRRDRLILGLLHFLYGSLLSILIGSFLYFISEDIVSEPTNSHSWTTILFYILIFILIWISHFFITYLSQKLNLKIRRCLQIMIYRKLFITDFYFLQNSDNNLIFRLLYAKLEEYVGYNHTMSETIPILMILLVLGSNVYRKPYSQSWILLALVLCRTLAAFALEKIKSAFRSDYTNKAFEQRKVLYEYISSFKSFTLINLKERYSTISHLIREKKLILLTRYHLSSVFERLPTKTLLTGVLLFGPLKLSIDHRSVDELRRGSASLNFELNTYFSAVYLYICLEFCMVQFSHFVSVYLSYKSSKNFFDKFFDNDFVVDRIDKNHNPEEKGSLEFEDCEILERNKENIDEVLNFILSKRTDEFQDSHASKNPSHIVEYSRSNQFQRKESIQKKGKVFLSKFEVICSNFSAKIEAEQKVCIFNNQNKKAISGFIGMILGHNFVNSGRATINGSISYFNPKKMDILVGKSIRENILFGQIFIQDRYDEILKTFGVQFGNYSGLDFHQVAENAVNIRTEDIKTMLFARFLYQESDIYIIEEYFTDLNLSIMMSQIKVIFKHLLQHKTVIFSTNNIEMIKMSHKVITFESEYEHHVVQTEEFMNRLKFNQKLNNYGSISVIEPQKSSRRVDVLRTKLKNSIFVANISFEEELEIHKKLEMQKAIIAKMKEKNTDTFELLTYGILLTHQKRVAGQYLVDIHSVTGEKVRHFMQTIKQKKGWIYMMAFIFFVYFCSSLVYLVAECLTFQSSVISGPEEKVDRMSSTKYFYPVIGLLFSNIFLNALRTILFRRFFKSIIQKINHSIIETIFSSEIRDILNKKTHSILDLVNKDLISAELQMPELLRSIMSHSSELISNGLFLVYCYSGLAVFPLVLFPYLCSLVIRKIIPGYLNISTLSSSIEGQIDDLNFQLLSLIGLYRIGGKIDKLRCKLFNFCNQSTRSNLAKERGIKVALIFVSTVTAILILAAHFGLYLLARAGKTNWLGVSPPVLVWSVLCNLRVTISILVLPRLFFEMIEIRHSYIRISEFLRNQKLKTVSVNEETRNRKDRFEFLNGIEMKRVSLTRGLQPVLRKISLKISHTSRVGFLGIDGGGRTSLFEILANVTSRDGGDGSRISLFGKRIEEVTEKEMSELVFFMERTPVLFEGSVARNLDPYDKKSQTELIEIMKKFSISADLINRQQPSSEELDDEGKHNKILYQKKSSCFDQVKDQEEPSQIVRPILANFLEVKHLPAEATEEQDKVLIKKFATNVEGLERKNLIAEKAQDFVEKSKSFSRPGENKKSSIIRSIPRQEEKKRSLIQQRLKTIQDEEDSENKKAMSPENQNPENLIRQRVLNAEELKKAESEQSIKTVKRELRENAGVTEKISEIEAVKIGSKGTQTKIEIENLILKGKQEQEERLMKEKKRDQQIFEPPKEPNKNPSLSSQISGHPSIEPLKKNGTHQEFSSSGGSNERLMRTRIRRINTKIVARSPFSLGGSCTSEEEIRVRMGIPIEEESMSDIQIAKFLESRVTFEGKNIPLPAQKLLMVSRAILSSPKILLVYEDSLDFGKGISVNLETLYRALPESTVLCILKDNSNLLHYDKIVFIDAGKVLEKGNPKLLLKDKQSYLFRFLKETDSEVLAYQLEYMKSLESAEKSKSKIDLNDQAQNKLKNSMSIQNSEANLISEKALPSRAEIGFEQSKHGFKLRNSLIQLDMKQNQRVNEDAWKREHLNIDEFEQDTLRNQNRKVPLFLNHNSLLYKYRESQRVPRKNAHKKSHLSKYKGVQVKEKTNNSSFSSSSESGSEAGADFREQDIRVQFIEKTQNPFQETPILSDTYRIGIHEKVESNFLTTQIKALEEIPEESEVSDRKASQRIKKSISSVSNFGKGSHVLPEANLKNHSPRNSHIQS